MSGGSTSTQSVPANKLADADGIAFTAANDPQRVVDIGTETSSIAIIAHPDNSGEIYVGFDEEMGQNDTFPLSANIGISMDLDTNEQPVYVLADTIGDEVRWIALD